MVVVAQLVEPWIVIPVVVGSSPIDHPKIKKELEKSNSFFRLLFAVNKSIFSARLKAERIFFKRVNRTS
jgi:hypothetical protein